HGSAVQPSLPFSTVPTWSLSSPLPSLQANLFPAALVHFGPEEPTGIYLEPTLLEHTVSPSAADVLVARSMSRAAGTPPPPPAPDPAPVELEPTAEEGAVGPREPSPGTAQPPARGESRQPRGATLPATGPLPTPSGNKHASLS
ncbi:tether containing UBX domain for GLUT4-like, partial [Physeter macrocephalus]|uniref:Tether containing UBX domain for GLUT4-like n=1 Tax=Physeter macrocephalus TaxID=9755 RepID=A0A455B2E8_PHYMC